MVVKETILAVLSDMHTGGSTALFPPKGYQSSEGNLVLPSERQKEIWKTFVRFAGEVSVARKGRRLIVVHLGDAIEGYHHNTMQLALFMTKDQCEAHKELMQEFLRRVGFTKGDELYYVRGTESHVGTVENEVAKEMRAVRSGSGLHVHEVLTMDINGTRHMFAHHGKRRGSGTNEGNSLRNLLRDVRIELEKDSLPQIDMLWSGHTHGYTWSTHIARTEHGFHQMHGVICPSWQAKTRYAYSVAPTAVNSIGGVYVRITVDGQIASPSFVVAITKDV